MIPKLSIITVVYNGEKYIEETIQSVVNQDYQNIEYIIIDGLSKDKTLEIVNRYASKVSLVVSEKDKGIYDAMNKGLSKATGDYVWFLNGGDSIPAQHTVSEMFKNCQNQDVIYGHAAIVDESRKVLGLRRLVVPDKLSWKSFQLGMVVCHQSLIVKRSIAQNYDLNYKIAADIDWAIRTVKLAKSFYNTQMVLCHYLEGGFSEQKRKDSLVERFGIMKKHYGVFATWISHFQIAVNMLLYKVGLRKNHLKNG